MRAEPLTFSGIPSYNSSTYCSMLFIFAFSGRVSLDAFPSDDEQDEIGLGDSLLSDTEIIN